MLYYKMPRKLEYMQIYIYIYTHIFNCELKFFWLYEGVTDVTEFINTIFLHNCFLFLQL